MRSRNLHHGIHDLLGDQAVYLGPDGKMKKITTLEILNGGTEVQVFYVRDELLDPTVEALESRNILYVSQVVACAFNNDQWPGLRDRGNMTKEELMTELDKLSDDDWIDVMGKRCQSCGTKKKPCYCWNDE